VTMGHEFFSFDNSSSYITSLTDVPANTKKPLNLISQTELAEGGYPIEINFYTTFGNVTNGAFIAAGVPDNPSGVKVNILGEGHPLQSVNNNNIAIGGNHSLSDSAGDLVSGEFYFNYSADVMSTNEVDLGLPYKIYLEHVEGDHAKKYAFITGVELSGSGLNYNTDSSIYKSITFRTGELAAAASPASTDGATLGLPVTDEAMGLCSRTAAYSTMMTEAHMSSIRTNVYTGDIAAGSENMNSNIGKMKDGHLLTQYPNSGIADIVTMVSPPEGMSASLTSEQPSGLAKVFSYTKPASDWKLFTGDPNMSTDTYVEHTVTGKENTPLRRHNYIQGENEFFLRAVLQAKNYIDSDPMVYRLVISGADGYTSQTRITGTVMEADYELPFTTVL